ncbi:Uncharacterized protein HZ326_26269 [Fusarium oxysporum f. sp. albedinis]|nr:Uncharacterized protein HZ326_26269 [Fusarium oxysporum f. sp. albedinis]
MYLYAAILFSSVAVSARASAPIEAPFLPGAEILSLSASPVLDYTQIATFAFNYNHSTVQATGLNICNVTITLNHPGQGDEVDAESWLPLSTWNGPAQELLRSGA